MKRVLFFSLLGLSGAAAQAHADTYLQCRANEGVIIRSLTVMTNPGTPGYEYNMVARNLSDPTQDYNGSGRIYRDPDDGTYHNPGVKLYHAFGGYQFVDGDLNFMLRPATVAEVCREIRSSHFACALSASRGRDP